MLYNSLAMFQCVMQDSLGQFNMNNCDLHRWYDSLFMDARWPPVPTESHLWFWEHYWKLKPLKCVVFQEKVTYLGQKVVSWGHEANHCQCPVYSVWIIITTTSSWISAKSANLFMGTLKEKESKGRMEAIMFTPEVSHHRRSEMSLDSSPSPSLGLFQ